jgi:hypothetical protein
LNGKKFEGVLAAPIDTGIIFPFRPKDLWQEFSDKNYDELHRQRIAKMPYLARHLGIQFEGLDLSSYAGMAAFYGCIAENLARLLVPGFQAKREGKWPRDFICYVLRGVDHWKEAGRYSSDLEACLAFLKMDEPDLARPARKSALVKKAKRLRNLVCRERQRKRAALNPVHKKPTLRIVK